MATLKVIAGETAGRSYELVDEQTVLGRHALCQVVLPTRVVSRQHARILRQNAAYFLEDLQSLNGTMLNDRAVEGRVRLQHGDRIRISNIEMVFCEREGDLPDTTQHSLQDTPRRDATQAAPATIVTSLDLRQQRSEVASQAKLSALLEISRDLGSSLDLNDVLPRILDGLFRIFPQADRGYVLLADAQGRLEPCAIKDRRDDAGESITISPLSTNIAQRVLAEGQAILSADVTTDQRFDMRDSVLEVPVRSLLCAPLIGPSHKPLGVIHIETERADAQFGEQDLEVLASVAMLAGQAVELARSHAALLELDRRQRDLAIARQVQLHFLPKTRPNVPGYEFFNYYHAADGVAGDYFDYINLPDQRLAIVLGDVAGKGMPAALLMARFCSDVRYCLAGTRDLGEAVNRLNRTLAQQALEDRFITFVLCVLDPASHALHVVNAGHTPPLLRPAGNQPLKPLGAAGVGPPLGIDLSHRYEPTTVSLAAGDVVVCYTDGVSDAMNAKETFYGTQAIQQVVAGNHPTPADLGKALLQDVRQFMGQQQQTDDICLLCFGRTADRRTSV